MRVTCSAVLAALWCTLSAAPQFRSDVTLVTVPVRVTNLLGHEIKGLAARDFTLLEDGRPQKIAFFAAENQPMSLMVLLDASSSMRSAGKYSTAKAALRRLLSTAPAGSQLLFVEFSDQIETFTEILGADQVTPFATRTKSGGTALYDAISFALCTLRTARYPRQAVIVATDGADQDSRVRLPELTEMVRAAQAQVFVLGYFGVGEEESYRAQEPAIALPDGSDMDNPIYVFDSLAQVSGADVAYPASERALERATEQIRLKLSTQYSLSYYLEPPGNRYRRIEVKVRRIGARARTRPGISVPQPGSTAPTSASGCVVTAKDHPYPYEKRLSRGPNGLEVYRDDFRDQASGWPNRESFRYGPAGYHILRRYEYGGAIGPDPESTVVYYGPWWQNFRASVTVSFTTDRPASDPINPMLTQMREEPEAGLAFRINDERQSSIGNKPGLYSLLLSGDGRQIGLRGDGHENPRVLLEKVVAIEKVSKPQRLGVECVDDEIRILLNGKVIGVVHDRARISGKVGLQLTHAGHAIFSDLVVEDLGAGR